jgi:hypothetical protein
MMSRERENVGKSVPETEMDVIEKKIYDLEKEIQVFKEALRGVRKTPKTGIGNDYINAISKRDVDLAARMENGYEGCLQGIRSIANDLSAVIESMEDEDRQLHDDLSSRVSYKMSSMQAILFIDKNLANLEKIPGEHYIRVSESRNPSSDLIEMLGGARKVDIPYAYSPEKDKTTRIQCHDLGFPFVVERYFDIITVEEHSASSSQRKEMKMSLFSSDDVFMLYRYNFMSKRNDIKIVKSLFIDLVRSSGIKIANVDKTGFSRIPGNFLGYIRNPEMVQEGLFIAIKGMRGNEAAYYARIFTKAVETGACGR